VDNHVGAAVAAPEWLRANFEDSLDSGAATEGRPYMGLRCRQIDR